MKPPRLALRNLMRGLVSFSLTLILATPAWPATYNFPTTAQIHRWSQRFGGTDFDSCSSVATDAAGNVSVTGRFSDTVNFGGSDLTSAGGYDIFLASYTSAGTHRWSQRFGGTDSDIGVSVATDAASNVSVTGDFQNTVNFGGSDLTSAGFSDIFLASYDLLPSDGMQYLLWTKWPIYHGCPL